MAKYKYLLYNLNIKKIILNKYGLKMVNIAMVFFFGGG